MSAESAPAGLGGPSSATFDEAWARFQAAGEVAAGQGIEDEWTQGRAQFLTFLVRVTQGALRDAVSAFVERLQGLPCLDLYPDYYWHVTVKMVGFQVIARTRPDEVLRHDVGPILYAAERALAGQPPFDAELGPVNAFPDAVFLEVHDGGRLKALHQRLVSALAKYPMFPHDGESFLPHLTLARYAGQEGLGEVKARLAGLRSERVGTLPVRVVELVKVWFTGDYPEFDVVQPIALGRPA